LYKQIAILLLGLTRKFVNISVLEKEVHYSKFQKAAEDCHLFPLLLIFGSPFVPIYFLVSAFKTSIKRMSHILLIIPLVLLVFEKFSASLFHPSSKHINIKSLIITSFT